jgi:ubiquinone/menaquinone biosynthesis C-methylase UbiE
MSEISENNKESKEENKKENTNIDKVIKMFERYFTHFGSIKSLDKNSDGYEVIYENIKLILNSSKFKIELFKREFKVYYNDNRKIEKKIFWNDGESNSFYE